jgi:Uma2 family endonuclease
MGETLLQISPTDEGRRMTLDEFEHAEAVEGYLYELSRGVTVVDVPDPTHGLMTDEIRSQLYAYRSAHRDVIRFIAAGSDCKILLTVEQSERHPDVAVYKTARPQGEDFWAHWVPELVIEIVSPSSIHRDYELKPDEYFRFGVSEYWIVDGQREEILVLSRSAGDWKRRTVKPGEKLTTWVLPGLELDIAAIFAAAK